MKPTKKTIKLLIRLILIGIFIILIGYQYLKTTWKNIITEKQLVELIFEIESSKELPNRFYELYDKEYPKALDYNTNRLLMKNLFSKQQYNSPSMNASRLSSFAFKNNSDNRLTKPREYILSLKLEEYTSQRQCLNWLAEKYDFVNEITGIYNASRFYFQKDIEKLNDEELTGLIVLMINPSLYNPKRRKELFETKVKELMEK